METLLIGTYTRKTSEGIYRIELNKSTNSLENLSLVAKTENPTYLEYNHDTKELYSVYQNDYDKENTHLKTTITQTGVQPCFVHYDHTRNELYDSNYHTGEVHVYQNNELVETFIYPEGAHAHYVHTDPKTGALFTVDLGNDRIHKYTHLNRVATYIAKEGSGPRHLTFHPSAPIVYAMTEYSNEVIVLKDDQGLIELQSISTLPEDTESDGAAIRISSDGKYVYVSNRGHDSISVFKVNDDYTLSMIQNISTHGEHPRDFNLSKDEDYLIVANRDTNNLVLYTRDKTSGELTKVSETEVQEPVSVISIG